MHERLLEFILTESNWPATSIVLAGFMSAAWLLRQRRQGLPPRLQIPGALNLLCGGLIGFTVVVVTAVGYLALLSGFLAFFAGGGSFEQFEGLE